MQEVNQKPSLGSAATSRSAPVRASKTKPNDLSRTLTYIIVGLVIFVFGLNVGQGKLKFSGSPFPDLSQSISGQKSGLDYSELDELYSSLKKNYDGDVTDAEILKGLKHGLAKSVNDPYTEYMSPEESADFSGNLQGTFTGIGARLEMNEDGYVVIAAPLVGSPAEAAGLRAKDIILKINDESAYGLTTTDAVKKIRGEKGSKVKLTVFRGGSAQVNYTVTRDVIKIPSVVSRIQNDGKVGYIQVSQFSNDTDELVVKAANEFRAKGVNKIILDLRDNPGGEVGTAVNLTSLWLKAGDKIVEQRTGGKVTSTNYANRNNSLRGIQTVVLINAGSASASEITALALRDHKATTIIGEASYGKGVVQQLIPLSDDGALKVTVAKWYSPSGTNIDKKGVKPDQEVKMTEEDYQTGNDPQLKAAEDFLLK